MHLSNFHFTKISSAIKRLSGLSTFHWLYLYVLVLSLCEWEDLNNLVPKVINDSLNTYLQWITSNWILNAMTTFLFFFLWIKVIKWIIRDNFSLTRLFSFSWLSLEAFLNEGWISTQLLIIPISYKMAVIFLALFCIAIEIWNLIKVIKAGYNKNDEGAFRTIQFKLDAPSFEDNYDRDHYARILFDKIQKSFSCRETQKSSFNVLINEDYGYGKSSFLNRIKKVIGDRAILVEFKPWLCENQSQLTQGYFDELRTQVSKYDGCVNGIMSTYMRSLSSIDNEWVSWIKPLTRKSMWQLNLDLSRIMMDLPLPVIVLIDDVDRLKSSEIQALFKLLRNTADFPNLVNIIAAKKSYIEDRFKEENIINAEEYLGKFFNFEMKLPANDNVLQSIITRDIKMLLTNLDGAEAVIEEVLQLKELFTSFSNEREWNRYYNLVSFNIDVLKNENRIHEVYIPDVIALSLVQYLSPSVYSQLRDQDNPILKMAAYDRQVYVLSSDLTDYLQREEPHNLVKEIALANSLSVSERNKYNAEIKTQKAEKIHGIDDFLKLEQMTPDLTVCKILNHLFPEGYYYGGLNRICYCDNFYRYFSGGKHKHNQISNREAVFLFTEIDEKEFANEIDYWLDNEAQDSFFFKIRYIISTLKRYKCGRLFLLKRIMTFIESYSAKTMPLEYDISDKIRIVFNLPQVYNLFISLYLKSDSESELLESEKRELEEFLLHDSRYSLVLSVLNSFGIQSYEGSLLDRDYCNRIAQKVWENVVSIIIDKKPFSKESLAILQICTESINLELSDRIRAYIIQVPNHLDWLFNCCLVNNDVISWNSNFKKAIGMSNQNFASLLINELIKQYPEEKILLEDFKHLMILGNLDGQKVDEHPFLKAVIHHAHP